MLNEQLQKQIATDAEELTKGFKDTNNYEAGIIQGYKEGYEDGGMNYASKWETTLARAERAEKALEQILNTNHDNHERVIMKVKQIAREALTHKTGEDE